MREIGALNAAAYVCIPRESGLLNTFNCTGDTVGVKRQNRVFSC